MVRAAGVEDLPRLLEMGRRFYDASGYDGLIPFDEASTERTMRHLIADPSSVLLIGDGGMAAGMVYPAYFNHAHKQAQELFWWVDEDKRKSGMGRALLDALETWAREQGADSLTMICLHGLEHERVGALYERAGYRLSEHTYIKRM